MRGAWRVWRLLTRIDAASLLLLLLVLVVIPGSCLPRRPSPPVTDPGNLAQWERDVRARYGRLTDLLSAVGAFRWFSSPMFWLPAGLLTLATLVCTINRWGRVWRRPFHRPVRCADAVLDSADCTAELVVSSSADLVSVVRDALRERGFQVRSRVDGHTIFLRGDRHRLAPLATLVTHTAILLLVLGATASAAWGWCEDFTLGPEEEIDIQHTIGSASMNALRLRVDAMHVSHYPDGSIAGYEVEVTVVQGGREAACGRIQLNEPFTYQGIGFYLRSYALCGEGYRVTLQAVRDPGYAVVVAAGLLLFLGLTVSFHFPHCCIWARIESQEVLRLAGHADRHVWAFERVFDALMAEIVEEIGT